MKKLGVMIGLVLCLFGAVGTASAATTGTITVTVSLVEVVSVNVTPTAWAIGPIALDGTDTETGISATNNGNVAIDLNIKGADSPGGWTINGTSTGLNQFTVQAANGTPALSPTSFLLTTLDKTLASAVATSASQTFDMTYTAPSSDDKGGGVAQGFSIVITASQAP